MISKRLEGLNIINNHINKHNNNNSNNNLRFCLFKSLPNSKDNNNYKEKDKLNFLTV